MTAAAKKSPAKRKTKKPTRSRSATHYWSGKVTRESNALDLQKGVFDLSDPKKIAASLKRSAERSHRRKASPYRSALSMLVFYINRAGKNLSATRRARLDKAKELLSARVRAAHARAKKAEAKETKSRQK